MTTGSPPASGWRRCWCWGTTRPSYEQAVQIYYLQASWPSGTRMVWHGQPEDALQAQRGGRAQEDALVDLEDVRGNIDPTHINSRFLQVLFQLASSSTQIELLRFITAMHRAPSVDKMFEMINSESVWRNNQAELIPWYDDGVGLPGGSVRYLAYPDGWCPAAREHPGLESEHADPRQHRRGGRGRELRSSQETVRRCSPSGTPGSTGTAARCTTGC